MNINRIVNGRLNGTLSVRKKHNLNLSVVVVNRENKVEGSTGGSFTEFTGTLGYGYAFALK